MHAGMAESNRQCVSETSGFLFSSNLLPIGFVNQDLLAKLQPDLLHAKTRVNMRGHQ